MTSQPLLYHLTTARGALVCASSWLRAHRRLQVLPRRAPQAARVHAVGLRAQQVDHGAQVLGRLAERVGVAPRATAATARGGGRPLLPEPRHAARARRLLAGFPLPRLLARRPPPSAA